MEEDRRCFSSSLSSKEEEGWLKDALEEKASSLEEVDSVIQFATLWFQHLSETVPFSYRHIGSAFSSNLLRRSLELKTFCLDEEDAEKQSIVKTTLLFLECGLKIFCLAALEGLDVEVSIAALEEELKTNASTKKELAVFFGEKNESERHVRMLLHYVKDAVKLYLAIYGKRLL